VSNSVYGNRSVVQNDTRVLTAGIDERAPARLRPFFVALLLRNQQI